jgi:DNA invertase Pin-like site-specific DNA recombinase
LFGFRERHTLGSSIRKGQAMRAECKGQGLWTPAAQYLRMSTEHQRYSMRNQARSIAAFAAERGYEIVRTYADPGRSGLTLRGRPGLKALLADAMSGERTFSAILVLDVSRWGRFQDLDQSAHYEFLCREAGAPVVYCAEPFESDGSPATMLVKQIKRLMAAEYSRELSVKVRSAQLLQAGLGHKQGGPARYGFRRVLVDRNGREVQTLAAGQRKVLNDHRVIYVRGPDHELAVIRDMFRMYTREGLGFSAIARKLNALGVPSKDSSLWTNDRVRNVLNNELVLGLYVFNLTSRPLGGPQRRNPPEAWVKTPVLEPIVRRGTFERAQSRMAVRRPHKSEPDVIASLRRLLHARGRLSRKLIDECPYTPGTAAVCRMFGSMDQAYKRVGYTPKGWWRSSGSPALASDEALLEMLRKLAEREGYISYKLINKDPSMPSASLYVSRFGSVTRAYQLAGLPHNLTEILQGAAARSRARARGEPQPAATPPRLPSVTTRFTDEELLDVLRRIHRMYGHISSTIIRTDRDSPDPMTFNARFGSLVAAYARAGLPSDRREIWARGQKMRQDRRKADTRRAT